MEQEFIGISDDRLKHMRTVAQQCYRIAKDEYNMSEDDARLCFLMGLIHDVGYEFTDRNQTHALESYRVLYPIAFEPKGDIKFMQITKAIRDHGDKRTEYAENTDWLKILNKADMTTDSKGNIVGIDERLADIASRYGEESDVYKNAVEVAKMISKGAL